MAGSVNKAILIGNLGKDPEIRRTQDGKAIANLTVATSESWRDKSSGERKEKTEWHRVIVFNEGLAKVAEQYLKKGSKVYVEGQIQTRKWTDQSGAEKYSTEIILQGFGCSLTMLDGRSAGSESEPQESISKRAAAKIKRPDPISTGRQSIIPRDDDMQDEVPF